jgi:hypothetical protein
LAPSTGEEQASTFPSPFSHLRPVDTPEWSSLMFHFFMIPAKRESAVKVLMAKGCIFGPQK